MVMRSTCGLTDAKTTWGFWERNASARRMIEAQATRAQRLAIGIWRRHLWIDLIGLCRRVAIGTLGRARRAGGVSLETIHGSLS